jgi:hypothetical protein
MDPITQNQDIDGLYLQNKNLAAKKKDDELWQKMLKANSADPAAIEPGLAPPPQPAAPAKPSMLHTLFNEVSAGIQAIPGAIVGAGETALNLAPQVLTAPFMAGAAIGANAVYDKATADEFLANLHEWTKGYQPKTESGKAGVASAEKLFSAMSWPGQIAEKVAKSAGADPNTQIMWGRVTDAATLILLPKATEAAKRAVVKPKPYEGPMQAADIANADAKIKMEAAGEANMKAQREANATPPIGPASETVLAERLKAQGESPDLIQEQIAAREYARKQAELEGISEEEWLKYQKGTAVKGGTPLAEDLAARQKEGVSEKPSQQAMEDLNRRAHDEIQSALDAIPEEEWNKYVDQGKSVDAEELAKLVDQHAERMAKAEAEMGEGAKLPQVYKDLVSRETDALKARAEGLREIAKEADQAGQELIVVPEVLTPRRGPLDILKEERGSFSNKPVQVAPKKISQEINSEEGYAYHATNEERLFDIAQTGKLKTHKAHEFTDQDAWPDGSTEKRSYFSNKANIVWQFAPEEGKPVIIRTKGEGLKAESTGDIYSTKPISSKNLEYLGEDDKWHPVDELKESEGETRSLPEMARDLKTILDLDERGAVGGGVISPEKQAAYNRLKADFTTISRNAQRVGKSIEDYLSSLGVDKELVALLGKEINNAGKQQEDAINRAAQDTYGKPAAGLKEADRKGMQPGGAEEPPTPDPELRVNLDRIIATDQVKNLVAEINREQIESGRIDETARGVRPHQETIKASRGKMTVEQLLSRKPGEIWPAEKNLAARDLTMAAMERVADLADKALAGDAEAAGMLTPALTLAGEMEAQRAGAVAEVGRALEAQKIMATGARQVFDPKELGRLAQAVQDSTGDPIILAQRIKALKNPEQRTTFFGQLVKGAKVGVSIFNEAWINGLLSGPKTHMVNTISNSLTTFLGPVERGVAAQIGRLSQSGAEGRVIPGEGAQMIYGLVGGLGDAFRAAGKAWRTEEPTFGAQKVEGPPRRAITADNVGLDPQSLIGGTVDLLGTVIRGPGRALMTADEFFKGINYRMELQAQAFREASIEFPGGPKKKIAERMAAILEDPPDAIIQSAQQYAKVQTFTNELGKTGRAFQGLSESIPIVGKVILPFVKTPTNILKYTWERTPALNMISGKFWSDVSSRGPQADLAWAKMATGGAILAIATDLVMGGNITGGGPIDRKLNKIWRDAGMQPYSIKIGDEWVGYNRLDPIGNVFGMASDFSGIAYEIYDQKGEVDVDELAAAAVLAVSNTMINKTYLQGLSDVISAIREPDRGAQKYIKNFIGSLVPAVVRQTEQIIDPPISEVNGLFDKAKANIPGLSSSLPPKRGLFAEKITPGGVYSPVALQEEKNDPVYMEILRNKVALSMPPKVLGGTKPSDNPLKPETAAWGTKLDPQQYDRFVLLAREEVKWGGMNLHDYLEDMINSENYKRQSDGPDGGKALLIRSVFHKFDKKAQQELMGESEYPQLKEQFHEKRIKRAQARMPIY